MVPRSGPFLSSSPSPGCGKGGKVYGPFPRFPQLPLCYSFPAASRVKEVPSMEKNKHLTAEDRKVIEDSLNHKMTYASIASALGKDPTTISKEVKNHIVVRRDSPLGKSYNNCQHQFSCKRSALCNSCVSPVDTQQFCLWKYTFIVVLKFQSKIRFWGGI